MAVFLGYTGRIELRRSTQDAGFSVTLKPSDVNADKNRFSFDFDLGTFLSGDQVELRTTDGTLLDFVAASGWPNNTQYRDGVWYLGVDEVGGIALYRTFDEAINNEAPSRVNLLALTRNLPINLKVVNSSERILGQVTSFEFNTERESVDVTTLSESFRQQYSSLISGNGRLECFFDYQRNTGDSKYVGLVGGYELPRYLNELVLRTRNGSEFYARLYLIGRGPKPFGGVEDIDDEVFYEINGIITNVGMSFESDAPVSATVSFITTGQVNFRVKTVSRYLLQENTDRIALEANQSGFIELED